MSRSRVERAGEKVRGPRRIKAREVAELAEQAARLAERYRDQPPNVTSVLDLVAQDEPDTVAALAAMFAERGPERLPSITEVRQEVRKARQPKSRAEVIAQATWQETIRLTFAQDGNTRCMVLGDGFKFLATNGYIEGDYEDVGYGAAALLALGGECVHELRAQAIQLLAGALRASYADE